MEQMNLEAYWYALYTKSRNEKKVAERFTETGIEHYLPVQKILKQWSDRKKYVQEVILKGYIFVYITDQKQFEVLNTDGVVCFVTDRGAKAKIPEKQILALKEFVNQEFEENYAKFNDGDFVEITRGNFRGLQGSITKKQGKHKVLMLIEAMNQKVELSIPQSLLKKITP